LTLLPLRGGVALLAQHLKLSAGQRFGHGATPERQRQPGKRFPSPCPQTLTKKPLASRLAPL
jgi:hypothetical protein